VAYWAWTVANTNDGKVDDMETIILNNGIEMPALGFGVFQTPPEGTRDAVRAALAAGYGTSTPRRPTATSARSARRCAAPT
jgi:hypothetical protein